jgi:hypothetical protein
MAAKNHETRTTFDDMEIERKLTVYDKGFDQAAETYGEYITRSGDVHSPRIDNAEPLRLECEHFVACVRDERSSSRWRRSWWRRARTAPRAPTALCADRSGGFLT